ncbi:MAG: hypothetical protein JNJ80_17485 [Gemmatimonadetes bacterium]|nr:hypothetical protein [Gemmatimonadota bacterium]MCC7131905.1 hypothetical protein [Gemmatimonadales bacterium]
MLSLVRRIGLAIASIAFALQTGTAAGMRCQVESPAAPAQHGGHHQSESSGSGHPAPGGLHCVCAVGCQLPVMLGKAVVVASQPRPAVPAPGGLLAAASDLLPLVARSHALPFSHAPPFVS